MYGGRLYGLRQLYFVFAAKPLVLILSYIGILFFCGCYTSILAGKHKPWLLLPLYLLSLGMVGYLLAASRMAATPSFASIPRRECRQVPSSKR